MKRFLLATIALATVMSVSAGDDTKKPQIIGGNFEKWHTAKYNEFTSQEPDGWHSFMSAKPGNSTLGNACKNTHTYTSNEVRPGSTGSLSVKLTSGIVKVGISVPANGTLTTGRLIAGSATASSTKNNSTSDPSSTEKDGAGNPFYAPLTARPDSIVAWVKFKQGTLKDKDKDYKYATISAIIHDNTKYQDPEDKTYKNVVAKAQNAKIESNGFKWQRISIPFDYESYKANNVEPHNILITFSTNAKPGVASKDADNPDVMFIDDVELVYNDYYTDDLVISANGTPAPAQKATITVTKYLDGTYNMMLKNFSFGEGDEALLIGDVTMSNITGKEENGAITFETEQDAIITNGGEIAELLEGKIHLKMNGILKDGKLKALITLEVFGQNIKADFGGYESGTVGIHGITTSTNTANGAIYDLSGRQLKTMQKGINIVRGKDGKMIKVMK
ncbi:calycin-like domain-containing protein [uncultured Prevotella sp.]|uniref:calycin-like domain-containing protein n=1 Tax=uncultured Prevotella sp. TaxID=159272 RepID=UPI003453449F